MRKDQEILEELQKKPYMVNKYQKPGIYTISLLLEDREILVYIGKSTDMLKRISSHMANIDFDKSNKYRVLRQVRNRGITIQFDTTYYSSAIGEQNIKENIGLEEVIEGDGVCVIEWPMYIEEFIPSSYLKVNITLNNNNSRTIEIESFGKKYDEVICKLKEII